MALLLPSMFVAVAACLAVADAAVLFQWKDAAGHWHFTDNPNQVPPQYRKQGVKKRNLQSSDVLKPSVTLVPATIATGGEALWKTKCASCHHIENDKTSKDGKLGLRRFVLNRETHYPFTPEQVLPNLHYAVSGRTSDMPPVDISDEDLMKIATYLTSTFK